MAASWRLTQSNFVGLFESILKLSHLSPILLPFLIESYAIEKAGLLAFQRFDLGMAIKHFLLDLVDVAL